MENLVVDLVGQVTNEDVEVARCILLVSCVGLISPVDSNLLQKSVSVGMDDYLYLPKLTDWWTRRPFKVCMARSAAPGSSYSTKP